MCDKWDDDLIEISRGWKLFDFPVLFGSERASFEGLYRCIWGSNQYDRTRHVVHESIQQDVIKT